MILLRDKLFSNIGTTLAMSDSHFPFLAKSRKKKGRREKGREGGREEKFKYSHMSKVVKSNRQGKHNQRMAWKNQCSLTPPASVPTCQIPDRGTTNYLHKVEKENPGRSL